MRELSGFTEDWTERPTRYAAAGLTTAQAAAAIDAELASRTDTPQHVLILLGTNDLGELVEADWKTDYRYILDAIHTKWSTAQIHCCKSYRMGSVLQVNPWIDDLVAEHPTYLFQSYDLADTIQGNEATLTVDNLHPNHAGSIAIGNAIATILTA